MRAISFIIISMLFFYACDRENIVDENLPDDQKTEDGNNSVGVPTELGTAAPVSSNRGLLAHRTSTGEPVLITVSSDTDENGLARTSLLIIDARTGQTNQYWHPNPPGAYMDNYAYMVASNGRFFYTAFGDFFLEFDLELRQWTFNQQVSGRPMSLAEAPDGRIFFANYPACRLYSFDPNSRTVIQHGRLDNVENYPSTLQVGNDGWVYAGIGTERSNLVAFNTVSNTFVGLMTENERKLGEGYVFLSEDGLIYATHDKSEKSPLFRLENGRKIKVEPIPTTFPIRVPTGIDFGRRRINNFPRGGHVTDFNMREKRVSIIDENGTAYHVTFDYESNGVGITSFILGPDGAIWGSTTQPISLWRYDPVAAKMGDWKGLKDVPGSNFPNLVAVGQRVYGALYNGGMVRQFDVSKPWNDSMNPLLLGTFKEIARPRAVALTSDGENVVFGGYPGYGVVGGDLVFVSIIDNKATLVKVQDQLPGLSTISLKSVPNGLLVGGTSVAAPGGGTPTATKAVLYLMDETRNVIFQVVPVISGADVESLEVRDGVVYGITSDSQFFVFDPQSKTILLRKDISSFGSPTRPGQSLVLGNDGYIYGVLSHAIFSVDRQFNLNKLTDLSRAATAGIAFRDDVLYFGCGSQLWSYKVR